MNKRNSLIFLIAIIILASFLRLWQIKTIPPGFYFDEAMNGNNAMEAWDTKNFKLFYPENNGREGLWINMMAPFLAIFGNEPWVPRTMAAIIGILTVLGLYFLTKTLLGSERIALFAAFFLATSFWHINFSRISFRAILAPFFLVWSFYFLWKVAEAGIVFFNSRRGRAKILTFSAIGGLLFGLGFYTYISFRVAPLLLVFPFIKIWQAQPEERRANFKKIFVFLIFAFLISLPIGIYFLQNPQDFFGRTAQISIFSSNTPLRDLSLNILKTIGMFFWRGDYNWRHNFSGEPELWLLVALLFLLGIIISLRNRKIKDWFLISWFAIMLLPAVVSNEGIPHALRAIVVIPPIMIFAALGLEYVFLKFSGWISKNMEQFSESIRQLSRIRKQLIIFLFVFFAAAIAQAYAQYFFKWANNPNVYYAFNGNYLQLGKYLKSVSADIPKYVIVNTDGVDVRGVPMPAQTVMFVTKTWLPKWQKEKNIFYFKISDLDELIQNANQQKQVTIAMLEIDSNLRKYLKEKIPDLKTDARNGNIILYK